MDAAPSGSASMTRLFLQFISTLRQRCSSTPSMCAVTPSPCLAFESVGTRAPSVVPEPVVNMPTTLGSQPHYLRAVIYGDNSHFTARWVHPTYGWWCYDGILHGGRPHPDLTITDLRSVNRVDGQNACLYIYAPF